MEIKSFEDMKLILRENDIPFFTDEDLTRYVEIYGTYEYALYKCLIFKSQNNQMQLFLSMWIWKILWRQS